MTTRLLHLLWPDPSGVHRNTLRAWPALLPGLLAALLCGGCATPDTASHMVISLPDQKMALFRHHELQDVYPVSTSKFGIGDSPGSYATPEGRMRVAKKIGTGAPSGAVFKSRRATGEILRPNSPGRDPIVSRIIWLEGLQEHNRNAFQRYIYIHGTTEEYRIGTPASYGCIRMTSRDVIDLYERIGLGAEVSVTRQPLRTVLAESKAEERAARWRRNAPDAAPGWAESAQGARVAASSSTAAGVAGLVRNEQPQQPNPRGELPAAGVLPPDGAGLPEYADSEFADGGTVRAGRTFFGL